MQDLTPELCPQTFWRGYDLYDPARVGFIVQGTAAQQAGTAFDTRLRGNSNTGHDFGTALLEYLKTL